MMLEDYLRALQARFTRMRLARVTAAAGLLALSTTALLTWFIVVRVPTTATVVGLRVGLLCAAVVGLAAAVLWVRRNRSPIQHAEARVPAFQGRLATWVDSQRRGDASLLLPLLVGEVAAIAAEHPPRHVVPRRATVGPFLAGLLAFAVLLWLMFSGGSFWQLAAQRLWLGDLAAQSQPRIVVEPGNIVVPRGVDVVVEASAAGFLADNMKINAVPDRGRAWESVAMSRVGDDRHAFVFVAVGDSLEYYVSARSLNSERFRIEVADLPRVTSIDLSYEFPEWTRLEVLSRDEGDVFAVQGTRVQVVAMTQGDVSEGVLVVNGEAADSSATASRVSGEFTVAVDGEWYVAVRHRGELARISDIYRIRVAEDERPQVSFAWPGRDRQATAIEEVAVRFQAQDDFGIEAVDLGYAINGGAWRQVALDVEQAGHVFYLEDLRTEGGRILRPGDVIAFYGAARDHRQEARTALYFVDVRPFDKRYRESQQMAGGASGAGGGDELDISQRQREILSATWNLINKQALQDTASSEIADEAAVVAMLQNKLREQVDVLVARAGARGLEQDESMATFVELLEKASANMEPVAGHLKEIELEQAVPPQQRALANLRTAEASIRDVTVAMARNNTGRGAAQNSLTELIDLEMDTERNRYEMPQAPASGEQSSAQASEWERLQQLAERQERLAEQRRAGDEDPASRWQQAQLQRELQEQLEALRERLAAQQQTADSQPSSSSATGSSTPQRSNPPQRFDSPQRSSPPQRFDSPRRSNPPQRSRRSGREVEEAIAALDRAQQALSGQSPEPGGQLQAGESIREAAQALRRAADNDLLDTLAQARQQADELVARHEALMDRLDAVEQRMLDNSADEDINPFRDFSMYGDADSTRRLRQDLGDVRGAITAALQTLAEVDEETASTLRQALRELDDAQVEERLTTTAEAFEMGRPLYALGHEERIRTGLAGLAQRLDQAGRELARAQADGAGPGPLEQVRALRQAISGATRRGGGVDGREVDALDARVGQLITSLGGEVNLDLTLDRELYDMRGTQVENTQALLRLTEARLDLLETALKASDDVVIHAQESRDRARDSATAAEYFRSLGQSAP